MAFLQVERVLKDLGGERDDTVAEPVLDQGGRLFVRERVRACRARGLDKKFLKHLDRKREVWTCQDRSSLLALLQLLGSGRDGVKEDVGIDEGHSTAAFMEGFTGKVLIAGEAGMTAGDFIQQGFQLMSGSFMCALRGSEGLEILLYKG